VWAPALSTDPNRVDDESLRAATEEVLSRPIDLFLATTGIGMRTWFAAAESWGLLGQLVEALGAAEILARGPKSVGALRRQGLRELWAPESEEFDDVLEHLRGRDLTGKRIVVQEHGQSLSMAAHALRRHGADVTTVAIYRVAGAEDPEPMFHLIDEIGDRKLHAVTFTSAPAVAALMEAAGSTGRRDDVVGAFQADVLAACVGPVTAAAFVAALDDVTRFQSAHQVMAYLGQVPSEWSSGERQHRGHITKAGSPRVRWLLVEAAWRILRSRDPQAAGLRAWAERIAARRGQRIAVVALARRLAGILYAMWRDGRPYDAARTGGQRREVTTAA
jgi:uroporphyrinogen-III synthase